MQIMHIRIWHRVSSFSTAVRCSYLVMRDALM
ncbi:hypothetical protein C5167_017412 [Papaver somniferum]|uniref:Uncharacterized protein n=1 Tax=Papaver somniferum TaxID=3469 RepID=A0A4Y7IJC1_PAPSO|nr:hypothetical protein C5167_017412 [Papaver somniferum]